MFIIFTFSVYVYLYKCMDKTEYKLFVNSVYAVVKSIPEGRATSYGAIAKAAGFPALSRKVGSIIGKCDSAKNRIPAHRVVNSNGILSGKNAFGNSGEMQKLLEGEGIVIINDRIKDWKNVFWNPVEEINI